MASGNHSLIMAACWSRGARSEVPEMLPPTVPLKFWISSATPYSVTEVPRIGMSAVAACAACNAGVALAMIRSTSLATKSRTMGEQVAVSPPPISSRISTFSSPSSAFKASIKPSVAASRATWGVSWQIPTTYLSSFAASHAAKETSISTASTTAMIFFIIFSPYLCREALNCFIL